VNWRSRGEFSVGDATKYQASIQGNTMRIGDLATFLEDWKTLKEKAYDYDTHISILTKWGIMFTDSAVYDIGKLKAVIVDLPQLLKNADNIEHIKIYAETLISIAKGKTEVNVSGVVVARALLGIIDEDKNTMRGKIVSITCELDTDDYEFRDGWCLTCSYNRGPDLPGGTLNEGIACRCSNLEHIKRMSENSAFDYDEIVSNGETTLFRWEMMDDSPIPCDGWALGINTPTLYYVKKVEKEQSNICPYCEVVMKPTEGTSVAGTNGFVTIGCAYCHKIYYYYDPELRVTNVGTDNGQEAAEKAE